MNIQDLKSNTTWQEASNTINNNNNKISLAIATLENAKLKNKGYFTTVEKLNEAVPNPTIGSKAYVGTSEPYAIYIVENGAWVDSGYTGGDEIVANITTDRIENGAVTSEKIATSAFDNTLSVIGKIAPADIVGRKLTELEGKIGEEGGAETKSSINSIDVQTFKKIGEIVVDIKKGEKYTLSMDGTASVTRFRIYINEEGGTAISNSFSDGYSNERTAVADVSKFIIDTDCTNAGTLNVHITTSVESSGVIKKLEDLKQYTETNIATLSSSISTKVEDTPGQKTYLRKSGEWVEFDASKIDAVIKEVGESSKDVRTTFSATIPIQDFKLVGEIVVDIKQGEHYYLKISDTASCSRFRLYANEVGGTALTTSDNIEGERVANTNITKLYAYAACEVSGILSIEITQYVDATGLIKDMEVLKANQSSTFGNKKWVLLGDSITAQGKYVESVKNKIGITESVNFGVGGLRMTHRDDMGEEGNMGMCDVSYLSQVPSDAKIITLMGGTNDWAQSMEIGDKKSQNTNEYCGALNAAIDYLMQNYPSARLVVMTPPYGLHPEKFKNRDAIGRYNFKDYSVKDYGNACLEVCKYRGIPCIDMSNCGWTDKNISTFVVNDGAFDTAGAYLHPNDTGGKRMASVIVGFLNSIQPISVTDL